MFKVVNSPYHCETFLVSYGVIFLRLVEASAGISDHMLLAVFFNLGKNSSETYSGSVCINDERFVEVRIRQYWGFNQHFFQSIKGDLLFISPFKRSIFFQQG